MDKKTDTVPGTIVWIAPFYNRSGYGIGARSMATALYKTGARIKIIPVNEVAPGIDDCDMDLIWSLEKTPIVPPVTNIITHVPSMNWFKIELPDPHIHIMDTMFDSSVQGNLPPAEWMKVFEKVDQVWLMVEPEKEKFIAAGLPVEKIQLVRWPHHWLDNPLLPSPCPEPSGQDKPFRFLSIAMFQPRRRWDTLIEAYLEEFKENDKVELYLKVNYPSWHCSPGKPRKDFHELVRSLKGKTGSKAKILIDEEIGTRLGIVALIDSCNAYVSTDTATTAPASEARVRHRMVIIPWGLGVGMPPDQVIPVDPDARIPLNDEMLQYQPHHQEAFMPMLHVKDVREAMRAVYEMTLEKRKENSILSASIVPETKQCVAEAIDAIHMAWQIKNRTDGIQIDSSQRIKWEGAQLTSHSLALINRELCLQLIDAGHEVSIIRYEENDVAFDGDVRFEKIVAHTHK
ncbi:MAG: hypothetical protein KJP07_19270, partial [Desulfatitalea sp.]|nr:hypothetical protein [Desulfatitalea sp.]